jgi:ABC-type transport system involved in cytochrome c biogenesis permease subunit
MCCFKPHRLSEFWTDPSSGELSMSRFGLGLVLLVFIPANAALEVLGYRLNAWSFLTTVLGILAGIYGVNSAAGAWKRRDKAAPPDNEPASQ